ncbi:hypothetical protein TSUD_159940 [Trifolium subterraneum]|uniref:Subtilisin-like protease fibronectin type-III domain-containing protein n=1 Tax=Trifolium subterraneum TaxID=3900 RepID=A0A2Z6MW03_TRISU|nr:hypothetical protein TSUD_159940 [Trifolium subterraneum]
MAVAAQQTYIVHMDKTKIEASIHSQDSTKPWSESIIDFISQASKEEEQEEEILSSPQLLYAYETNMFVVCERGINSRTEKGEEVKKSGGYGMILLNSENQGEELLSDAHVLPATSLGASAVEQPNGVIVSVEPRKLKFEKLGQKLSYKVTFLAVGKARVIGTSSFGSLIWVSHKYKVRSPIAVTWQ